MSYTALVLDENSRSRLLAAFPPPDGWEVIAHHMTINLGSPAKGPAANLLGSQATMKVVAVAQDNKAMAVQVQSDVPSINSIKHITIAVNRAAGGKPFDSNKLLDWSAGNPADVLELTGTVKEVG